jgi:hypothetical protein
LVRFVLLDHPVRGRLTLLCPCLELEALEIVRLYGLRFKIEVCFRQALHTLGTYAYHFWMKLMTPHPHTSGNQYLHRTDQAYRDGVRAPSSAPTTAMFNSGASPKGRRYGPSSRAGCAP